MKTKVITTEIKYKIKYEDKKDLPYLLSQIKSGLQGLTGGEYSFQRFGTITIQKPPKFAYVAVKKLPPEGRIDLKKIAKRMYGSRRTGG